jgi:hypothetical protein
LDEVKSMTENATVPSLGFTVGQWLGEAAEKLCVGTVHVDGIAAKAGIQPGDILTAIGNQPPMTWVQTGQRIGRVPVTIERAMASGIVKVDAELVFQKPKRAFSPHEEALLPYLRTLKTALTRIRKCTATLASHSLDPSTVANVTGALDAFIAWERQHGIPESLTPQMLLQPLCDLVRWIELFESCVMFGCTNDQRAHDASDLIRQAGFHVITQLSAVCRLLASATQSPPPPPPHAPRQRPAHPKPGDYTRAIGSIERDDAIPMMGAMNIISMDYGSPQPSRLHNGSATQAIGMAPEKRGPGLYKGKPRPMGGAMTWQDSTGGFIDEWND